jgi:hypothetical protein
LGLENTNWLVISKLLLKYNTFFASVYKLLQPIQSPINIKVIMTYAPRGKHLLSKPGNKFIGQFSPQLIT